MQFIWDLLPASFWPTQPFISPDEQARTMQALWAPQAPANAFSPVAGGSGNLAGLSSSLLDWPVVAPLAGVTEYATRALANHVHEVYSAPPDHYQMQHPGAGSLPHPQMYHLNLGTGQWDVIPAREVDPREAAAVNSTVSGVGNALISPFVAFKEAWDPPLHPPPNSTFDDGGTTYVDDANGVSRPWSEVDPRAAQAYYEQERRRADFAPSFALNLLGGGASFAERGAIGIAGSRLGGGTKRPPKRSMETAAPGASPGETAAPLAQADAPTSPVLARPALTGQNHHAISRRVCRALDKHPGLAGIYEYRDPRLATRAIDLDAHNGYQTWHRNLDSDLLHTCATTHS